MVTAAGRLIGAPIKRVEDPRFITGGARYVADIRLPGTLSVAFLRSPYASARIRRLDISRARALPGVVAVLTGEDVAGLGEMPVNRVVAGMRVPPHPLLVRDRVRTVGEPVAAVVAETPALARDALELIDAEYEAGSAVVDPEEALKPGAPLVHPEFGTNVAYTFGQEGGDVEGAFARADRVVRLKIAHSRIAAVAMEPRGALAAYDPATGELTVWVSTQSVYNVRNALAAVLGIPDHRIRVIAPDVGGGFGSKGCAYREEVLTAHLARTLGRPVRWVATRSEDLLSTMQAREEVDYVEAAVTADGRLLGLKVESIYNLGAFLQLSTAIPPLRTPVYCVGAYDIPNVRSRVTAVFTNTIPTGPYRGAGRPEAAFVAERLMDTVARELGLDPAEVRRRNFIRPRQFPYRTATGVVYDSGNYEAALDRALELVGYNKLRREQARAREQGKFLGIGLATYVELSAQGWESGAVRVEPSGRVTVLTGAVPHGQGHETTFSQLVADQLGVPVENIRVRYGDTAAVPVGIGTFGSRSAALAGSALVVAAERVKQKALQVAAHLLEASPEDLVYEGGKIFVRGAPGQAVTLEQVARAAYSRAPVPGIEPGLEATAYFQAPQESYSFGAYVAVVKVDPETGVVRLEKMVAVDDCGRVINPLLVEGQVHGGLAQGIGQALLERIAYDENGQLLTGSLLDYALPRADDLPVFIVDKTETPTPNNPLGVKGVGEAGTIGAPPAVVNAVVDALAPLGVRHIDMPLTPERVLRAIVEARQALPG
ncbi:MAG: carbon monoxide dehydrogenase [Chloroflexota bacterium]